ncbi:putative ABC-type transport system involved in lysophospholipase L1 biosynthesis, ATPase component [Frateuria aurantia DSM 6220]|uniref:Putative ABC-type transport system involved in lysophospholipase L1 biosynthesis, ATPase component n=2 Tax=Frateuria aurantia TaxID=81475 RepID=H8L5M4_FRAAD|nr:putative ABC-type transport system involved in lysophospholipase L1 biosynthesis, ATPase component [Frateuria aurantia DSM 6220]
MLAVRHLSKTVTAPDGSRLEILRDIELRIERGASCAIVGSSGSGKTTLLGLLAGLDLPSAGEVVLAGQSLQSMDEEARAALRRRLVGFVFQSFHLLPALTAEENVMLPLELEGIPGARERARQALQDVGLADRLRHYPSHLSGGEQQRVAIARAFVHGPELLFADEPTGNLDGRTGHSIVELLFRLNRERATTLVLVTHDPALAALCTQQVEVHEGRLLDQAARPRQVRA